MSTPLAVSLSHRAVLAPSHSSTPSLHPRRGRKLCRWRRKALINTTVSDRYADPRHCKMAAISPSHSSGRQPSPASSSSLTPPSLHPQPTGPRRVFQFLTHYRYSPSPSSRSSAARAPDFHTPAAAAAATATAPPHQVERVEVRTLPLPVQLV